MFGSFNDADQIWALASISFVFLLAHAQAVAPPEMPTGRSNIFLVQDPADVAHALNDIQWAWNDYGPCTRFILCATYFDSFGVNITFSDGSIAPFAHVYRLTKSAHDCIVDAKAALAGRPPNTPPDRGMAVQWVMATQIHNRPELDWLRTHPDAVVVALNQIH